MCGFSHHVSPPEVPGRRGDEKRKQKNLNDSELEEFLVLAEEEETFRLKRVRILGELAQLKNISLPQLTEKLGIKPLADA